MLVNFEDAFMPSEEKKKLWEQTVRKAQAEAVKNKKCWMCTNIYFELWNNHGHPDHTTHCKFTKECVDFNNGKDCQNWKPREIT